MDVGKLSRCNGFPHHAPFSLAPCGRISRRGCRMTLVAFAGQFSCLATSSRSCDRRLATKLSLAPLAGAVWNVTFFQQSVRAAAEEALSSSSANAASTQFSGPVENLTASGGSAASQAVKSFAESIDGTAAGSQALQSSVGSVKGAVSQTAGATVVDGNMVINVLGTAAFVALVLLTISVVYIFITDFLAKRKSDEELKRLNEEETAARKKSKASLTPASKGGGKGFGRRQQDND